MADFGHEESERMLQELEKRLNAEYTRATREIYKTTREYWESFQVKNDIKIKQLRDGLITQDEYNHWLIGQTMIGTRWNEMCDTLAHDMHSTNEIAASITRQFSYEAYALNHNYGTFEVERGSLIDTSYTLYDRSTVERLVRDDPSLLPPPGKAVSQAIREGKDVLWNKQLIQSVAMQSILQGESIPKIAKRLAQTVGDSNRHSAVRNARTMMTGAQNAGRVDSYKRAEDMGIKMEQVWLATLDGRTRHSHRQLDGYKIKVGGKFPNGCRFPGDPQGPAWEIYNCRCTLIGQVEGVDYNVSDISQRNNYKLGGMTYDEWRNEHGRRSFY